MLCGNLTAQQLVPYRRWSSRSQPSPHFLRVLRHFTEGKPMLRQNDQRRCDALLKTRVDGQFGVVLLCLPLVSTLQSRFVLLACLQKYIYSISIAQMHVHPELLVMFPRDTVVTSKQVMYRQTATTMIGTRFHSNGPKTVSYYFVLNLPYIALMSISVVNQEPASSFISALCTTALAADTTHGKFC